MHFAYGRGTCPFGSSCFYLHAYPDGTIAENALRKMAGEDGEVRIHSTAKYVSCVVFGSLSSAFCAGRSATDAEFSLLLKGSVCSKGS